LTQSTSSGGNTLASVAAKPAMKSPRLSFARQPKSPSLALVCMPVFERLLFVPSALHKGPVAGHYIEQKLGNAFWREVLLRFPECTNTAGNGKRMSKVLEIEGEHCLMSKYC
jgi:hypothetical protein